MPRLKFRVVHVMFWLKLFKKVHIQQQQNFNQIYHDQIVEYAVVEISSITSAIRDEMMQF